MGLLSKSSEFTLPESSTNESHPYIQEYFDLGEQMKAGNQCDVRAYEDRIYKVVEENLIASMFEYVTEENLGVQDRIEAEINALELEEIGINVPSIINHYDNVLEMEKLEGVNLDELIEDVDNYNALKEIGAITGAQLKDMTANGYVKMDYLFANIWAETSNIQDNSAYNLEETHMHSSQLPSNPENEGIPVFQIDNELMIENPSEIEIKISEAIILSDIRSFGYEKSSPLEEGFKEEYGEVDGDVEALAELRGKSVYAFSRLHDIIN